MSAETIAIRVGRAVAAPPERVFDAWLDPELARRFLFATEAGTMLRTEIEPRVGGRWVVVERRGQGDALHTGRYLTIERPRRLVFTFSVGSDEPDADRIEIDFEPAGAGSQITLTHHMKAEWQAYADRTTAGWSMILEGLEAVLNDDR